ISCRNGDVFDAIPLGRRDHVVPLSRLAPRGGDDGPERPWRLSTVSTALLLQRFQIWMMGSGRVAVTKRGSISRAERVWIRGPRGTNLSVVRRLPARLRVEAVRSGKAEEKRCISFSGLSWESSPARSPRWRFPARDRAG